MSLKRILHKEYENILKHCLVFATIVYNLLIFNMDYFRMSKVTHFSPSEGKRERKFKSEKVTR